MKLALCVLLLTVSALAQQSALMVELKIQVSGLDQVQSVTFILHRLDQDRTDTKLFTNSQGAASIRIPAGRYELTTISPVRAAGQVYTWDLEIPATEPVNSVDLTPANATVTPDSQTRRRGNTHMYARSS